MRAARRAEAAVAQGRKRSLAARVLAPLCALALLALAAWLWLRPPPAPHAEIGAESEEALRDILRDAGAP